MQRSTTVHLLSLGLGLFACTGIVPAAPADAKPLGAITQKEVRHQVQSYLAQDWKGEERARLLEDVQAPEVEYLTYDPERAARSELAALVWTILTEKDLNAAARSRVEKGVRELLEASLVHPQTATPLMDQQTYDLLQPAIDVRIRLTKPLAQLTEAEVRGRVRSFLQEKPADLQTVQDLITPDADTLDFRPTPQGPPKVEWHYRPKRVLTSTEEHLVQEKLTNLLVGAMRPDNPSPAAAKLPALARPQDLRVLKTSLVVRQEPPRVVMYCCCLPCGACRLLVLPAVGAARASEQEPSPFRAQVVVHLPAEARLFVDGQPADHLRSDTRSFFTPDLELGRQYAYTVRAEVARSGGVLSRSQRVFLWAGKVSRVDFGDLQSEPVAQVHDVEPAHVTVRLPRDAHLFVNGVLCPQDSDTRSFFTPLLEAGREYAYTLRSEVVRDGQERAVSQRILLRAGKETVVDLTIPSPAVTSRR